MNYLKDKKIIALAGVLLVFTISYFITINKISYAFANNVDSNFYHDQTIKIIEQGALKYAKENKNEFNEEKNIKYISVQELIDTGYLIPDEEGNIKNPLEENSTFNSKQIMIKLENDTFSVKLEA